ncbi:MAG: hypothetical protein KDK07_16500 [Bauldia sp.]|nr:hypothetical protein [Bauldia sp.]
MARLVLSIGGMVLGNLLLPGLGSALGGVLGSYVGGIVDQQLFGPETANSTIHGPRMQDLRVQSSGYGAVIPRVYGKARVSGNVIWMRGFHEETRSQSEEVGGGGKGGGGDSQTVKTVSYHYYADLAVGLCEGPIDDVTRIWADSHALDDNKYADLRVYRGTNGQSPDPLIQAVKGVNKTPAYRGLAYVVLEKLYITPFGNRLPNLTFEIKT